MLVAARPRVHRVRRCGPRFAVRRRSTAWPASIAPAIGWIEKRRRYAHQTGTIRLGVGVAVMNHTSGAMPMLLEHTVCTVKLNDDATAEILFACSDMWQGSHTALKQIAAEILGFPFEHVQLSGGTSDVAGYDIGAHASRTIYVGGAAVTKAWEYIRRQLLERASRHLGVPPDEFDIRDKRIFVKVDPARGVDAKTIPRPARLVGSRARSRAASASSRRTTRPPFGASFAEVEVDTETGEARVLELVNADDIGRAIGI